ncbi:nitroreductase family deazaflavin-dependent oxidoreductase [Skermania sp. ID1734]|uniref:nitroreductase family deazaflavin-dependent oxidoreductase n=1 Tax=Skermania sp. ID1734 TaxID=2597516 RepID=UPI00351BE881
MNRKVTNRLTGTVAGHLPGYAIVVHKGRKSGREYRTPVSVFSYDDGYRFALTYGVDSDWVKNVLAEGGCLIETRGRTIRLTAPRLGEDASAAWAPFGVRQVLTTIAAPHYLHCEVAPESDTTS